MEAAVCQYLQHLRLEKELPSINYLQRLIQHHLSLVPYETFSKFHYFLNGPELVPSLPDFVKNLTDRGWGGTCFTLNMNFARLLSDLGFDCSLVRVQPSHLAIMVEINGKRLYVDVGYGSPIMKPIELEAKPRHVLHGFGEEIIFTKIKNGEYEIDRRSNGKSFVKKLIKWAPLPEEHILNDIGESYADRDENITMRRVTAVRFNGHQCFFLRNRTMKVMTYRNISELQINEQEKWINLIHEVYQIDKNSMEPVLTFLKNRGVNLF
ncbi:arylamine N-acetyltransferase [Siminovitchia fortis]|uniref:Arylamine N-acetyltransferase n=1 Tax=Siminovitchia fortis TaxID=254758 RepID=A0A443IKU7_9BACI|nr:arylamine N-acetyltransferase [Siminovitchia fortis]RWR05800.1 arylamine N-acetyltransferase [Siminovitchia fortis]WHY80595.1 arylamine N-acetyltransferase [Siminovitchia fortis]